MPRPLQCIAAQKHHPHRCHGFHSDAVAGRKIRRRRALIALARDLDLAVDQIDRALLIGQESSGTLVPACAVTSL